MNRSRWLWLLALCTGLMVSGCVVETDSCIDSDGDLFCDEDDCFPDDAACVTCGDPICEVACNDTDLDTVCDEFDDNDCIDDRTNVWTCAENVCTTADNFCADGWELWYCADGGAGLQFFYADCNDRCQTDEATWSQACTSPASAGECSDADYACLCWCEDSFDQCVNDFTVQYTREGVTYQVDCKDYCGGTCDLNAGACSC